MQSVLSCKSELNPPRSIAGDINQKIKNYQASWYSQAKQAHYLHKQGRVKESAGYFESCVELSLHLIAMDQSADAEGIQLYYYASHNLAACYNQQQQASKGETLLRDVYLLIAHICQDSSYSPEQKHQALATLDKSLFSLSAQLAYMGKTAKIHPLIRETEAIAEWCMEGLAG